MDTRVKNEISQRICHILVRITELTGWKASLNAHSAHSTQLYTEDDNPLSLFHKEHEKMASKLPFKEFSLI